MARRSNAYVCQNCGAAASKWSGRCESCGEWNTLVEELAVPPTPGRKPRKGRAFSLTALEGETLPAPRTGTGIAELDRVTGGGLVPGSAILVGGDPGIGKSTLLLQAAAAVSAGGGRAVYISGEEAIAQMQLRARRLGLAGAGVALGAETNVEDILATLQSEPAAALVIIDSIQTMWSDAVESAPGTVAQVRAAAQALIRYAKGSGAAVALVGHVTKDGQIAGPRVVEHMVDAVLYFEGDRGHRFRILRGVKNRFGPTDEIGVFDMTGKGLEEVENPSALFIGARDRGAPGAAVFAGIEGTRPLLVEIQALVAPSPLGTPRRAVVGTDSARLAMILAVLEARCGISLAGRDVYLNVAGGLRIQEPAADLAVAAALVSSLHGEPLDDGAVWFGEVSLSGALRPVAQSAGRLREAAKLGFTRAVLAPTDDLGEAAAGGIRLDPIEDLARLVLQLSGSGE
jgi:DNA repair protein RadA/Sms